MSDLGLVLPTEEACSFCDYLSGERAYTILNRTETVAILVTREQRGIDHLLVIPVAHVATLLEVEEAGPALMRGIVRAATAIASTGLVTGVAVWQNNGVSSGQAIPHLHFHVAGTDDQGGTDRGEVPELPISETEEIASRLRPLLPPP